MHATGDSGKVGISAFDTTATTQNMDGKFYCDIVQYQLKPFMAQTPKKNKFSFQQALALWHILNVVKERMAN